MVQRTDHLADSLFKFSVHLYCHNIPLELFDRSATDVHSDYQLLSSNRYSSKKLKEVVGDVHRKPNHFCVGYVEDEGVGRPCLISGIHGRSRRGVRGVS